MAGEIIRPSALPPRVNPVASEILASDNGSVVGGITLTAAVNAGRPLASEAEAVAGVEPTKAMTPLTTRQHVTARIGVDIASKTQGDKADSAVQTIGQSSGITVDATDPQNPIVSYTGAGVSDGDKGDVTVSASGADWAINAGIIVPSMLKDEDAKGFRMAANVRGQVNFFDLLQETRSSAVREQIMNGTFTGDLAVEWQQFRDALAAIDTAGGRPYGFIPECKIYSSAEPNFAMDYLTLETQGHVRIEAIGDVRGFVIDGMGLGVGSFGVRHLNIGPLCASTVTGGQGIYVRRAHKSDFWGLQSLGSAFAGIHVDGCVTSNFHKPVVSPQAEAFVTTPPVGLYVSGTAGPAGPEPWRDLLQTSWCKFDIPVMEYMPIGIQFDHTFGNTIVGGTSEACSNTGMILGSDAVFNKIIGIDFEQNTTYDLEVLGSRNEFYGVDSQGTALFQLGDCYINRIFGGHWGQITFASGTKRNLVVGANVNSLSDNSTGADRNRIVAITDNSGNWTDRWISYAPTPTAVSGTLTTASAAGEYRVRDGDTVDFKMRVTITTNGTGAGAVKVSLPFAPANGEVFTGAETGVTLVGVQGVAAGGSTDMFLRNSGAYPGANGAVLNVQGTYRMA